VNCDAEGLKCDAEGCDDASYLANFEKHRKAAHRVIPHRECERENE